MANQILRAVLLSITLLVSLICSNQTAQAGPPLICHPYEIGNAKSLPWAGTEWRSVKADYDLNRLVNDTLALLTPDTPVIVRMETLRRATIYAVWARVDQKVGYRVNDLTVARELLARLQARAQEARGKGRAEALALLDVGYLAEAYKQSASHSDKTNPGGDIDGYALISKALSLVRNDPEMEFAAAMVSIYPKRDEHTQHLRKAVAGAPDGSLLARNIVSHLGQRGQSIADLRADLKMAKN